MDQFRAQTVSLCWLGFVRHNLVGQFSTMAESLVRTEACYDLVANGRPHSNLVPWLLPCVISPKVIATSITMLLHLGSGPRIPKFLLHKIQDQAGVSCS